MKQGAFTFVLHSHLPYSRQTGRWPHGEEWIHEATAETYVPLLNILSDLAEHEVPARLTLGITPVLAEQLADPLVIQHFETYLLDRAERAARDVVRFERVGDLHATYLAHWYEDFYNRTLAMFRGRFNRDLIGAARRLQDSGHLEIAASAATHGYLPLLGAGLVGRGAAYHRHADLSPGTSGATRRRSGCRSAPTAGPPHRRRRHRPGLEDLLAEQGLSLFFAETHAVVGGRPVGKAMNEVIGPYGAVPKRYLVPTPESTPLDRHTTFEPYHVGQPRRRRTRPQQPDRPAGLVDRSRLPGRLRLPRVPQRRHLGPAILASDRRASRPGGKDWYHPDWAEGKISIHAHHFARIVEDLLRDYHERTGPATACLRPSTTRSCSATGGSRGCAGWARSWRGWLAAIPSSCAWRRRTLRRTRQLTSSRCPKAPGAWAATTSPGTTWTPTGCGQ